MRQPQFMQTKQKMICSQPKGYHINSLWLLIFPLLHVVIHQIPKLGGALKSYDGLKFFNMWLLLPWLTWYPFHPHKKKKKIISWLILFFPLEYENYDDACIFRIRKFIAMTTVWLESLSSHILPRTDGKKLSYKETLMRISRELSELSRSLINPT